MFEIVPIKDCFRDWIGFNQPYSNCKISFLERITTTESTEKFSDFNNVLTTENLHEVAPNFARYNVQEWTTYAEWNNATTYNQGDLVTTFGNQVLYESLVNSNTANTPSSGFSNTNFWKFVKAKPTFENWLFERRENLITQVFRKVFRDKKLDGATKELFQYQHISSYSPSNFSLENNDAGNLKFVGWRIDLSNYENLKLMLLQVGLKFTGVNNFTLYLYAASQNSPIAQIDITTDDGIQKFTWEQLNWDVRYTSELYDRGDTFFLGYYQNELSGQAVNEVGYSNCNSCYDLNYHNNYWVKNTFRKWINIVPIEIDNAHLNGTNAPDFGNGFSNVKQAHGKTYGLNFQVSVKGDLTDFLCKNKSLFSHLLGLQFAVNVCNEFARTTDSMTGQKLAIQDFAQLQIQNKIDGLPNIFDELKDSYEAVDVDLSNLKSPLFPRKSSRYAPRMGSV